MAKVDLKAAYRSVEIRPDHCALTGLSWTFNGDNSPTYILDRCLGFGARKSPSAFNRITQSVCRMMQRRGYNCVCYLDDFFLCENSFEQCLSALTTLIFLLRSLNFKINWKKVVDPCRRMTFLGVEIDLDKGQIQLDPDKALALCDLLRETATKKRMTKVQLQALSGRLIWASRVHPWGRWHMAPFFHLIGKLQGSRHKAHISAILRSELEWWLTILSTGSNCLRIWDTARPVTEIATDSCTSGAGVFSRGDCTYVNWILDKPALSNEHINIKELATIQIAVAKYAPLKPGHHLIIYTDNSASCHMVNKGYSRNHVAASLLRDIAVSALSHDCTVTAYHIPGALNHIPDAISRLHQRGQWQRLASLLHMYSPHQLPVCEMSSISYAFLFQLWYREFTSWTWRSPHSNHTDSPNRRGSPTPQVSAHTSTFVSSNSYNHYPQSQ